MGFLTSIGLGGLDSLGPSGGSVASGSTTGNINISSGFQGFPAFPDFSGFNWQAATPLQMPATTLAQQLGAASQPIYPQPPPKSSLFDFDLNTDQGKMMLLGLGVVGVVLLKKLK